MAEACDLTGRNAARNGVADRIRVARGDLFEAVGGLRFDVVVDDVSGVAEEVAVVSSWFPPQVPLGGSDGTSLAIAMLRQSPQHLRAGGQLFFPVLSLSNGAKIVAVAREIFGDRLELAASRLIPFNQELKDNLATLERLRDEGLITFEQVRSRLCWSLEVYRATAPA
jgi:precorrin-6B methylase 2